MSEKKVWKKTIAGTIGWFFLLLVIYGPIVFILRNATDLAGRNYHLGRWTILSVGLSFLIFVLTYLYQSWYFVVYYYDLTDDFISIRKGPITPREITIPYERIQDVYVDQDILDRMFGLYDVHVSSATVSSGMEAHIDGVEKQAAEGLRAILLQTVQQKISRSRVMTPDRPAT